MMVLILGATLGLVWAFLFGQFVLPIGAECSEPCVPGSEDIMSPKAHGSSEYPVQSVSYVMMLVHYFIYRVALVDGKQQL